MEFKKELTECFKKKYPKNVYIDIFNILSEEDCKYSSNNNGIFINLDDISERKITECLTYFKDLENNIEDHMKNLSLRETLQMEYKSQIVSKGKEKVRKKETKKSTPVKQKVIKNPFEKKKFTGVYDRIDRAMRGVKQDEKNKRKASVLDEEDIEELEEFMEELDEEEIVDDVDLFGEEDLSDENA